MDATIGQSGDRVAGVDPAQRSAALADARRRASQAAVQDADAAEARKAEQLQTARKIIERALGANTKLSIARNDTIKGFVYRAIDVNSGEVVREWPPVQFAQFLREHGAAKALSADALSGLLIDEQA